MRSSDALPVEQVVECTYIALTLETGIYYADVLIDEFHSSALPSSFHGLLTRKQ